MSTSSRVLEQMEALRDVWEKRWCFPWTATKDAQSLWSDPEIAALADLPTYEVTEIVQKLLEHPSVALRGIALREIARRRDDRWFPLLQDHFFEQSSVVVRAMAAAAIGVFNSDLAIETLLETRDQEHAEVKLAVVHAFHQQRDLRCIPLLARWVGRAGELDELRRCACSVLGAIADDAAMPILSRVLDDETVVDEVRTEAASAIAKIGGAEARSLLLKMLHHSRPALRIAAIEALMELRDRTAVPLLLDLLSPSQASAVRIQAFRGLVRLGTTDTLRKLANLMNDSDPILRIEALGIAEVLPVPHAKRGARSLLNDRDPRVQLRALEVYSRLVGQDFIPLPREATTPGRDAPDYRAAIDRALAFEAEMAN